MEFIVFAVGHAIAIRVDYSAGERLRKYEVGRRATGRQPSADNLTNKHRMNPNERALLAARSSPSLIHSCSLSRFLRLGAAYWKASITGALIFERRTVISEYAVQQTEIV